MMLSELYDLEALAVRKNRTKDKTVAGPSMASWTATVSMGVLLEVPYKALCDVRSHLANYNTLKMVLQEAELVDCYNSEVLLEVVAVDCNLVVYVLTDVDQDYIRVYSVEGFHSDAHFVVPNQSRVQVVAHLALQIVVPNEILELLVVLVVVYLGILAVAVE